MYKSLHRSISSPSLSVITLPSSSLSISSSPGASPVTTDLKVRFELVNDENVINNDDDDDDDEEEEFFDHQDNKPILWYNFLYNLYFWANITYIIYSVMIILLDLKVLEDRFYIFSNLLHVFNGIQYLGVWLIVGYHPCAWVTAPEWLNILAGILYTISSTTYPLQGSSSSSSSSSSSDFRTTVTDATAMFGTSTTSTSVPDTDDTSRSWIIFMYEIEWIAAIVQCFAAILWFRVWRKTYDPRHPYRGFHFKDWDMYSNGFNLWASVMYVIGSTYGWLHYRSTVVASSSVSSSSSSLSTLTTHHKDTNNLLYFYMAADSVFFLSSLSYLAGGLRDEGYCG